MSENAHLNPDTLDDTLAAFTDSVLRGESVTPLADDSELGDLQAAVVKLSRALNQPVSSDIADRIRTNLAAEWNRQGMMPVPESLWQRLRQRFVPARNQWISSRREQRAFTFALAGLTVIFLISLLFLDTNTGPGLPGGAQFGPLVAVGSLVILGLGIAIWWVSQRKK